MNAPCPSKAINNPLGSDGGGTAKANYSVAELNLCLANVVISVSYLKAKFKPKPPWPEAQSHCEDGSRNILLARHSRLLPLTFWPVSFTL